MSVATRFVGLSVISAAAVLAISSSSSAAVVITTELDTATSGVGATSQLETTSPYQYAFDTLPTLSATDLAQGLTFTKISGDIHGASGSITKLTDGQGASNNNDAANNYFSAGGEVRILGDLGSVKSIDQVNTYSWHLGSRTGQVYSLYAAVGTEPGFSSTPASGDPATLGYTLLDTVTQSSDGWGGQFGVSFQSDSGSLGNYRYLLWKVQDGGADGGTFFSEFDVVAAVPEPATLSLLGLSTLGLLGRRSRRV